MLLRVIATGSTGNAYVLEAGEDKLLLDCGIPWPRIQEALDYDLSRVTGALISHEHKDHCKGVEGAVGSGIDCYMSAGTMSAIGVESHRIHAWKNNVPYTVGNFIFLQFATEHDAADPVGWMIRYAPTGEVALYATDTYYLRIQPRGVHYYLLECNYISDVLERNVAKGRINAALKKRLITSHFELHNLIKFLRAAPLRTARKIVLVHMSDGNSDERHMVKEIEDAVGIETVAAQNGMVVDLCLTPF